ncbi:MAG: hypothetical protein AAFU81_16870, partial [Pseudomonadota bacterium]
HDGRFGAIHLDNVQNLPPAFALDNIADDTGAFICRALTIGAQMKAPVSSAILSSANAGGRF